jgi:hypothetical protein
MIEPRQQSHVGRGKSRAPTIDGVVNLASQIFEVLAPYLWHDAGGIPLPQGSVTGLTQPEVALPFDGIRINTHSRRTPLVA